MCARLEAEGPRPSRKEGLDSLYRRYNRRAYVHPDPLEFLYRYESPADQEIVGLVAACLAYGRVAQILASVARVLGALGAAGGSPRAYLERVEEPELHRVFRGFTHRFTTGAEVAALLVGVKRAIAEHASLESLFAAGMESTDETILPALARFVNRMRAFTGGRAACPSLLSSPADGSACKRLNLFLRWMARRDAVDPGPWSRVPRSMLVVPLDTHLFRIAGRLGLTARRQADLKTAMEITKGFARFQPKDPVRYDFCLTRLGINPACRDTDLQGILAGSA
jgi:uncharacterized protein (TIGR02757 family)